MPGAARWRECLPPAMVGAWQGTLTTRRRRSVARALHALGEQRREQSAREFAGQSGTPRESSSTPQEGAGRRGNPRDDPPLATNQKAGGSNSSGDTNTPDRKGPPLGNRGGPLDVGVHQSARQPGAGTSSLPAAPASAGRSSPACRPVGGGCSSLVARRKGQTPTMAPREAPALRDALVAPHAWRGLVKSRLSELATCAVHRGGSLRSGADHCGRVWDGIGGGATLAAREPPDHWSCA